MSSILRKEAFNLPDGLVYLDGNSLGPLPRNVPERLSGVVNREWGGLLIKGWNAAAFVNHPDRLRTPLIRRGDGFEQTTWYEALALVTEKLGAIHEESGPNSIAFLYSAKCTKEENYLLQKFARAAIKTNNVDHCARL